MNALNRLTRVSTGAARAERRAQQEGLSFRDRMKKMAPLRVAGWRQLLRLNREAQVDAAFAPPTAPPGYAAPDAAAERAQLRRIVEQRKPELAQSRPADGLDSRRGAVLRMLELLEGQQAEQERIRARGVWAEGQR
jgi:hypothetical protein